MNVQYLDEILKGCDQAEDKYQHLADAIRGKDRRVQEHIRDLARKYDALKEKKKTDEKLAEIHAYQKQQRKATTQTTLTGLLIGTIAGLLTTPLIIPAIGTLAYFYERIIGQRTYTLAEQETQQEINKISTDKEYQTLLERTIELINSSLQSGQPYPKPSQ